MPFTLWIWAMDPIAMEEFDSIKNCLQNKWKLLVNRVVLPRMVRESYLTSKGMEINSFNKIIAETVLSFWRWLLYTLFIDSSEKSMSNSFVCLVS